MVVFHGLLTLLDTRGNENTCPPKAEVTGSNPVGCASSFNELAVFCLSHIFIGSPMGHPRKPILASLALLFSYLAETNNTGSANLSAVRHSAAIDIW